ncbi:PQQ-dependent sugar dehydrogenase [Thalassotalea euphylliae]|uniref:PQQ-dependent sugar dehydrogenase n=1 Tax=Thalassotalea euphylliae TaxID=1655234 RepID=A0A3E0TTH3_9GAMM|nr:PQQ-dependent sugar dehydrogenase [Thalassotalea euphylliae]REL27730.1 PQQ-dependent sugar dehydrogenase [Thalassotalea euphylliae]
MKLFSYPTKGLHRKQFLSAHTGASLGVLLSALLAVSSLWSTSALAETAPSVEAAQTLPTEAYAITTIATELKSPWSMVQLPDNTWLITERDGHVVVVKGESQARVKVAFDGLYHAGQGGLLDIVLAPDFNASKAVFFTYAQGELNANRLVIAKAIFDGTGFSTPEIIYQVATDKGTPQHYAGRALILPDNTMLFASGDGFDYREQAQVKTSQLGKLLRINLDGSIPQDNPFANDQNTATRALYSIGHRNTQGLIYDTDRQQIVSHEHGPAGGDELNYIIAGANYGWPVITYGKDYSQARISPFTQYPGMKLPSVDWTPSIAPSGMAYYASSHKPFASLQQQTLISTLVDRKLYAVNLSDGKFTQSHVFPDIAGRLRDVYVAESGAIAVLTDGAEATLLLISAK